MPFYTFKCPSCNKEKEVLQKMNEPEPVCERCVNASCGVHIVEMVSNLKVVVGSKMVTQRIINELFKNIYRRT